MSQPTRYLVATVALLLSVVTAAVVSTPEPAPAQANDRTWCC
ncbi:hypothetical protein [Nocardioides plantarum]